MCNDKSDDLEEYIKEQKDFLDISLRFEKLVSRLLVIYIGMILLIVQIN